MISTPGGISNLNMRSGKGEFFSSALKVGTGDCQRHRAIPSIPADRYENQAESADRAIRPFFWASFYAIGARRARPAGAAQNRVQDCCGQTAPPEDSR